MTLSIRGRMVETLSGMVLTGRFLVHQAGNQVFNYRREHVGHTQRESVCR